MVGKKNADTANTVHLWDVAMEPHFGTTFWLSLGYNFGCVIVSGTIFDTRGGFRGHPMKT